MKKITRHMLTVVLTVTFIMSVFGQAIVHAEEDTTYEVVMDVTYGQTEARTMLDMINTLRTGEEDSWYYNSDGSKNELNELNKLEYDYELEKIAMQRAAEIAFSYSHTRPNGKKCFTAYNDAGYTYSAAGENIAAGYTTAEAVFTAWEETDEDYAGQGHRRNMLNSNFKAVGIGHVYANGYHYWVQVFSGSNRSVSENDVNDSTTSVTIEVLNSAISSLNISISPDACTVDYLGSCKVPVVNAKMRTNATWPTSKYPVVTVPVQWTTDSTCITLNENDTITGNAAGTGTLTTTALGQEISTSVIVSPLSLAGAEIVLDLEDNTADYTGNAVKPAIKSVTLNGMELTEADYCISYENNTEQGTAEVIITGQGNYTGSAAAKFRIVCKHKNVITDEAVAVTCTENGWTEGSHCSLCKEVLIAQEEIPATGHSWNAGTVTTAATCTTAGVKTYTCKTCGETKTETIAALGHNYSSTWTIDKEATCTDEGSKSHHCTRCKAKSDVTNISAAGHSWNAGTVTTAATCITAGVKTYTCKTCGKTKTETIVASGHSWAAAKVTKAATTSANGMIQICCKNCSAVKSATTINKIASVTLNENLYTYNGKVQKPSIVVKDSAGKTISSSYYTVSYASGRKLPGTYKVTVKFKGRYSGTVTKSFKIQGPKGTVTSKVTTKLYGYDDIKVSWNKVSGAVGYYVGYKKSTDSAWTFKFVSSSASSLNLADLADGVTYNIRVYPAVKLSGKYYRCCNYKAGSNVTTLKKISTPTVKKSSTGKVSVSWTNIAGETGYQISQSTSKTGTNIVVTYATTTGKSKVITATKNKTYYYKVRAYKIVDNKKIYGPWSNVVKYVLK